MPRRGGRLPDPGDAGICGRCGQPRLAHGGPKNLGACPGERGLHARRYQLAGEDKAAVAFDLPSGGTDSDQRWQDGYRDGGDDRSPVAHDAVYASGWMHGHNEAHQATREESIQAWRSAISRR